MRADRQPPGYLLVIPWDLDEAGGVSQVVANLHRELTAFGWATSVLVASWDAPRPTPDRNGGIPVLRWRIRSPWCAGNVAKGLAAFVLTFPALCWRWRRLARQHGWQVVNLHYPDLSGLTLIALKRLRLWCGVIVLSVHGREIRDAMTLGGRIERWLMRAMLEHADGVVACSAELAADTAQLAPRARGHIAVIPNGVSPEQLRLERDAGFELPPELASARFILNVATFEHKKSQDVLVDAFALVAAADPAVHLVMVGRETPWLAEVRGRALSSGVADRVHVFVNLPHGRVLAFMQQASVFCLPSRAEGHPLAILEAAALGVPVVATPVGGIPETIGDDRHGLLVPVGEVDGLARALLRVLGDSRLARALGGNLQRRVAGEFTWAESARRYSEVSRKWQATP